MMLVLCSDVTWVIRNNELGGQIAPGYSPLAQVSTDLENFAPTGAEGVPNAPLFVPYQVQHQQCTCTHAAVVLLVQAYHLPQILLLFLRMHAQA